VVLKAALSGCILDDEMALDLKGEEIAGRRVILVEYEAMREVDLGMARENALKESIVLMCCWAQRPKYNEMDGIVLQIDLGN
jgi:hypothetical protein